jgi:hypothetical protein
MYLRADGAWSLRGASGGDLVRVELADGYDVVQGFTGAPRVLSTQPNELGMTIEQAIERGVVSFPRDGASEFERPTLVALKAFRSGPPK